MKTVESSAVVVFRALVMLACLIFVPLAAIFGSICPEIVRSTLVEPILGPKTQKPGDQSGPGMENVAGLSALFGGSAPESRAPLSDNGAAPAWQAAAGQTPNSPPEGHFAADAAPMVNVAVPANYAAPADAAADVGRPNPAWDGASVNGNAAVIPGGPPLPAALRTAHNEPAAAAGPDRFSLLERRLREYGAIYYLLETWGNEGELYRFHCKMAIANNPNYTRHFEATHRDALQAMTQVLEQIEAWRAK